MNVKNEKVLITGAGGFIGSHLCEALVRQGAQVRAMVRYNSIQSHGLLEQLPTDVYNSIEIFLSDVRDPQAMRTAVSGSRVVFHLAALIGIPYSYQAPRSYVDTNVYGTLNVAQACLEEGVERLVHTSTSEVYGSARYTPIDEKHPLQGQSPYSASKIAADKIVESFYLSFNLPVVTIRPFNCFGPRQSPRAFIPAMISQLMSGDKELHCGLLTPIRDFTFVRDTAAGFVSGSITPGIEGMTINVGSGRAISMGNLLYRIMDRMNICKEPVFQAERIRPEKSEVRALICDNSLAKTLLGWTPAYTLDEGLDEVIEFCGHIPRIMKTNYYVV